MSNLLSVVSNWTAVQRVSICDERPAARTALSRVISSAIATVTIVDNSADAAELLEQYSVHQPDLVLVGVRNGKQKGVEAVDHLLGVHPSAAVIVYGSMDDTRQLTTAIEHGARGFLLWDANNPVASPARQRVSSFRRLAPNGGAVKAAAQLTESELQILR